MLDTLDNLKYLQAGTWLLAFLISVYLTGGKHWKGLCLPLKIGVGLWNGACIAEFIIVVNAPAYEIFPWGFSWFYALTPLVVATAVTIVLIHCHRALRELNSKNNRRSSVLISKSQQPHCGQDDSRSVTTK